MAIIGVVIGAVVAIVVGAVIRAVFEVVLGAIVEGEGRAGKRIRRWLKPWYF